MFNAVLQGRLVDAARLAELSALAFALTKTRLAPNFDTALSVTTILADHLART